MLTSLNLDNIKVLHLEPTTNCNAACPQCKRTYSTFTSAELTLDKVKELFTIKFIQNLDKMFMCGNLGDPAAAQDTLAIFKYFKEINPNIVLGMNTNGGIRTIHWWHDLADILTGIQDYVVFSIDGLSDTNHIHRKNVVWNQVMKNANSFIANNGSAHWDMLVFKHNQHQIDEIQQLAKDMKFTWFRAKVSKRHIETPITWLQPPSDDIWKNPIVVTGVIDCYAIREKSIYVDAQGIFYPCCWLGNTNERLSNFDQIQLNWNTKDQNLICAATCTKHDSGTSFTNQWQREVALN
jgi:MoaA/NifB/PqqE/SkfB family radical SAM enzyme